MESIQKWFQKNSALLKTILHKVVIYCLALGLVWFLIDKADWLDAHFHAKVVREQVQHGIVLVLVFYVFYHTATTVSFINHIRDTVVDLLAANRSMFDYLSTSTKERYVANSIQSTLGDVFGKAVVDEIVSPYLRSLVPVRKQFEYHIVVLKDVPAFGKLTSEKCRMLVEKLDPKNGYLWLNQICKYAPKVADSGAPAKGPFLIAITFDNLELQRLLPHHRIFFRESHRDEQGTEGHRHSVLKLRRK